MSSAIRQFSLNIESIDIIDSIYIFFEKQVKAIDLSEILRAQYVLLVSALDCYIHDLVRDGMLSVFDGKRTGNDAYDNFPISLKALNLVLSAPTDAVRRQLLDAEIRKVTSKHSYQAPSNIERALALIGIKAIWKMLSVSLRMPKDDIVKELGLIIHRRNKIAHEADIDPLTNNKMYMDRQIVSETKLFIVNIVNAIDSVC